MKKRAFAEGTTVSVAKSEMEIKTLLTKHGATSIGSLWNGSQAMLVFEMQGRKIKMQLPLPTASDPAFATDGRGTRGEAQREAACEAERRRRYRALGLVIRAKLESVASGIESFQNAFLAHVMTPDGSTVGEWAGPVLADAYQRGVSMPPMLGSGAP